MAEWLYVLVTEMRNRVFGKGYLDTLSSMASMTPMYWRPLVNVPLKTFVGSAQDIQTNQGFRYGRRECFRRGQKPEFNNVV